VESAKVSNNQELGKENMVHIDAMKLFCDKKIKLCHLQAMVGTGDNHVE
jgi:hypothetical protein